MARKKAKKIKKNKSYIRLIAYMLVISTLFLSIGWSAYETTLSMDAYAYVRIPSEVRVTGFSLFAVNNGGVGSYEDYNVHYVTANASLPNANSTVTYKVEITNMQLSPGTSVGILDYFGLPEELDILSWSGYSLKDRLCDDHNPSDCGSGAQKTFYITVGYKDASYYDPNETYFIFDINFDFREFHAITYTNISGNYPSTVLDGDDLDISLSNITSLQLEVRGTQEYLENIDYTYTNGELIIENIEEDLIIRQLPAYTITYNANGGNFTNNQTTNDVTYVWRYGQNNILSGAELTPTFSNSILYKWYYDTGFNTEFDKTQEITHSGTVYARWVNAVVEMNGNFYNSFAAAMNQITDTTVETTINLLKDTSENLSISAPNKIIINLQGHTLSNNGSATLLTLSGKLTLNGGTVTSNYAQTAVINVESGGNLTINNTTVSATANNGKQVIYSYGALKITGTSYISTGSRQRSTVQLLSGGSLEMTGGTIIASGTKSAVEAPNSVPIIIGVEDGSIDVDSILLQGADFGIIGNFEFYDGTIKGKNGAYSGRIVDKEEGRGVTTSTEKINNVDYEVIRLITMETIQFDANGGELLETERYVINGNEIGTLPTPSRGGYIFLGWFTDKDNGTQIFDDFVVTSSEKYFAHWEREYSAQIGQNHYYSIQDAVNAATNNVQTTILVTRDSSEAVNITQSKDIELDLQGYTLSFNGAAAAIECYGKLHVYNGSVTSASQTNASINIRSGGRATIMDVNVLSTGSRQAVYNYGGGKVTIGGNSYISSKTTGSANGSAIERGTVNNLATGTLTILGGTFVGINQQAISNEGTMTIGVDDGSVDNSSIEIIGATYGIKSLSAFDWYDGIAKGRTAAISGTVANWDSNSTFTDGLESIDGNPYYTKYLVPN